MQYRKCSIVNDTASCTCVVSHVKNNVRLLFPLSPILLKHINFSIIDKIFLKFLFSDKYIGLTVIIFQSCLTKQTFKPLIKFKKELSLCHKLWFFKHFIFGFQCRRPQIFLTMNSVRSNNVSLKYQRFATLGSKDIGIINSEFVAKTQFLFKFFQRFKGLFR